MTVNFSYDLNGNMLSDGAKSYDYDDANQLVRVTVANAWKSEFTYDGLGRRRKAFDYGWSGSAWTLTNEVRYVWQGMLVVYPVRYLEQRSFTLPFGSIGTRGVAVPFAGLSHGVKERDGANAVKVTYTRGLGLRRLYPIGDRTPGLCVRVPAGKGTFSLELRRGHF